MTVSTHVYSAVLLGSPNVPLSVRGGSIMLNSGRNPHVECSLTVVTPGLSTFTMLDPRLSKRIRITVSATFPTFTQSRTFDLGLRSRPVRQNDGTLRLDLASDEALLADYAPLTDDLSAFSNQSSLRAIVNYVLDKAIPGEALESSPAVNADATVYSDSTNLIPDPSAEGDGAIFGGSFCDLDKNDTSWAAHGTKSLNLYSPTSTDAWLRFGAEGGEFQLGMRAGQSYMFSATGRVKAAVSGAVNSRARRLVVLYRSAEGGYQEASSVAIPTTVGVATRVSFVFTIPDTATEAFVRAYHGHAAGQIQWDAFRLSPYTGDPTDTGYFDGGTTDTSGYLYGWTEGANSSPSSREALIDRVPDSLRWKTGQSALDFLAPLVQVAGFRLVCDENRAWTLRDENYSAPGSLSIRYGVNMIDGTDTISRDSGLWFDAAVTEYEWTDANGTRQERADTYALVTPHTRLKTFRRSTAYPGPGFSEYAVRRAQGRGREVTATAVADWSARAEQDVTIMLLNAPTQIGATQAVSFDLDRDEMTVTTRTTDTPLGAVDLLVGTVNGLTGTVNAL